MKRLTYDFEIGGNHCWQVKGADNLECREVCERQGDDGCKTCPIAKAFDRLAAIEDILGDEYDLDELREMVQANIPRLIDEQSTISAVPVVRCRECENYDENGDCISLDLRIGIHSDTINYDFCPDPDFYCAYGRRKIETVLPKSDAKDGSLEGDHG